MSLVSNENNAQGSSTRMRWYTLNLYASPRLTSEGENGKAKFPAVATRFG